VLLSTTTTTVLRHFFQENLGEPVPKENPWTLLCKGRLTEADTPTIRLGAPPSGLTSAHLHHLLIFYRPDALPAAQPTVSNHWRQLAHSDNGEKMLEFSSTVLPAPSLYPLLCYYHVTKMYETNQVSWEQRRRWAQAESERRTCRSTSEQQPDTRTTRWGSSRRQISFFSAE